MRYLGWQEHADGTRVHRHLIRLTDDEVNRLTPGGEEQVFRFHAVDEISQMPTTDRLKTYLLSVLEPLRGIVERGEAPDSVALRLTR